MYQTNQFRRIATLTASVLLLTSVAAAQSTACDLDASGTTNVVDVTQAVNMVLGLAPCTASVEGPLTCTVVTVQRIVNASLGQPCVTYNSSTRSVHLTWLPSPSPGVTGYNVYRRVGTSGSFSKVSTAQVTGTTFIDSSVVLGTTYQYAVSALDLAGNESALSTPATAIIPAS